MKALITGITGRIGANLAAALMKKGYEIRGLVMPNDPKAQKARRLGVEIVEADLGDAEKVARAVDGVDVVAHLAAQIMQGNTPADRMYVVNTLGTANLLEGALKARRPIQRFLLVSTDQTYSPFVTERTVFYEDHPQKPLDIYGLGKFLSEQIGLEYYREYGLPVTIVRYTSVVAGDEPLVIWSPTWLSITLDLSTAAGRRVWFGADKAEAALQVARDLKAASPNAACGFTDPQGTSWALPFTDVRDCVQGTLLALENPAAIGDAFNLAGPAPVAAVPAAQLIAQHTERPYREVRLPFLWSFYPSSHKARTILGYNPQYDFPKMIEGALALRRGEDVGVDVRRWHSNCPRRTVAERGCIETGTAEAGFLGKPCSLGGQFSADSLNLGEQPARPFGTVCLAVSAAVFVRGETEQPCSSQPIRPCSRLARRE